MILTALAALALEVAARDVSAPRPPAPCGYVYAKPVRRDAPSPGIMPLGALPPANLELAVLRTGQDGCPKPMVVSYDVQGNGHTARPGKD